MPTRTLITTKFLVYQFENMMIYFNIPWYMILFGQETCSLINIKVLMPFLPMAVHNECEVLPLNCFWWISFFLGIKPADCETLPKEHQLTCLKSKGRYGSGRGLNPWPPRSIKFKMVTGTSTITGKILA